MERRRQSLRGRAERLATQADILGLTAIDLGGLSDSEWVAFARDAGVAVTFPADAAMCGMAVDLVLASEQAAGLVLHEATS